MFFSLLIREKSSLVEKYQQSGLKITLKYQ